jgi:uncharacterized protein YeaO (DUF488 family)
MTASLNIRCRRVYDPSAPSDGLRVLVDRLWPRGLSRERAKIDWWPREIAPSAELRRWFGHDPQRWEPFCQRDRRELDGLPEPMAELVAQARGQTQ